MLFPLLAPEDVVDLNCLAVDLVATSGIFRKDKASEVTLEAASETIPWEITPEGSAFYEDLATAYCNADCGYEKGASINVDANTSPTLLLLRFPSLLPLSPLKDEPLFCNKIFNPINIDLNHSNKKEKKKNLGMN